jgi:hypothetical protein
MTPVIWLEDPAPQDGPLRVEVLAGHRQTQAVEQTEAVEIRGAERSVRHVEVFRLGCVRTPIIGRPRPPPHDRRARTHIPPGTPTPSNAKSRMTADRKTK